MQEDPGRPADQPQALGGTIQHTLEFAEGLILHRLGQTMRVCKASAGPGRKGVLFWPSPGARRPEPAWGLLTWALIQLGPSPEGRALLYRSRSAAPRGDRRHRERATLGPQRHSCLTAAPPWRCSLGRGWHPAGTQPGGRSSAGRTEGVVQTLGTAPTPEAVAGAPRSWKAQPPLNPLLPGAPAP